MNSELLRLFLCGDVMTGRGIDQALPYPVNPVLFEPYLRDARDYIDLAEKANGPIRRPLSFDYIWGEALNELDHSEVDLRIVNLETVITTADTYWPGKEIHYRMHPRNVGCLSTARINACALANNHVLDWGYDGLSETLQTLDAAAIAYSGAGSVNEATSPAVLNAPGKARVLLFSFGSITSGIPREWGATSTRPGVNLIGDLSEASAARTANWMRRSASDGQLDDLLIASIHWGSNWGNEIPREQIAFAHRLIEEGVALVHGHSSHHVKAIEIFKGRLILYGCGDFLADYEGISAHEEFRGDLAMMYFVDLDSQTGQFVSARLTPMQMRRFRLEHASSTDARWLCDLLNKLGAPFGTQTRLSDDHSLALDRR